MNNPRKIGIDASKCNKDGICIKVCPCGVFSPSQSGIPVVNPMTAPTCINCGHCVAICPSQAITVSGKAGDQYENTPQVFNEPEKFTQLVKTRRSIRSFQPKQVPMAKLVELIELTKWAPTAKNTQMLSWTLINGADKVKTLSSKVIDTFRFDEKTAALAAVFDSGYDIVHRGAPHVILVHAPSEYNWGVMDGAIALSTLELAAHANGIGACWAGFTAWGASLSPKVGESVNIPPTHKILGGLMIGYATYTYKKVPPRKDIRLTVI
jgi:nitroreductase/NAD-dependent dihydropyrimidine dehydrogenase PreA subunit